MTNDIEKMHIIHRLKSAFQINDLVVKNLLKQVDPDKSQYADRFFGGYTAEDRFGLLFGALPWVVFLHGVNQEQIPETSKEEYQVPDYIVCFETSKKQHIPVLIEVKCVSGEKTTLHIMKRQLEGLQLYSDKLGIDLLFAIYWEKAKIWTLNTPDILEMKNKELKINFENSFKNDLSVIFGDITFLVNRLSRLTTFDSSVKDSLSVHEKYGAIISDKAGLSDTDMIEIEPVESAIIDSYIKMVEMRTSSQGSRTEMLESLKNTYMLKLSTIIMHHLAIMDADITPENAMMSRRIVIEFMKKIAIERSFAIPSTYTTKSDAIFRVTFEGTWVLENYFKVTGTKVT